MTINTPTLTPLAIMHRSTEFASKKFSLPKHNTYTRSPLQDALKQSEETTLMLQELVPGLDTLQMQLMVELGR